MTATWNIDLRRNFIYFLLNLYFGVVFLIENQILNRLIDYFKISGRITRKTFILRMVGLFVLSFVLLVLVSMFINGVDAHLEPDKDYLFIDITGPILIGFILIYILLFIVFSLAQEIKRLQDMNSSGWWLLLRFIPIVSLFYLLWLLIGSGTVGPNKYGDDPKNRIKEMDENVY